MINPDLLHQTTDVVVDQAPGPLALIAVLIALAALTLTGALPRLIDDGRKRRPYLDFYPTSGWPVIVAVPVGVLAGLMYVLNRWIFSTWSITSETWLVTIVTGIAIVVAVIVMVINLVVGTKASFTKNWTRSDDKKSKCARITTVARWSTLMALFAGLVAGSSFFLPTDDVTEPRPTAAAVGAATKAETQIADAIESDYDVEILGEKPCRRSGALDDALWNDSAETTEQKWSAHFIKGAFSGDPSRAGQIRVLTPEGVTGCYGVTYDPNTDTAHLYVDAENTDLPVPVQIAKE